MSSCNKHIKVCYDPEPDKALCDEGLETIVGLRGYFTEIIRIVVYLLGECDIRNMPCCPRHIPALSGRGDRKCLTLPL